MILRSAGVVSLGPVVVLWRRELIVAGESAEERPCLGLIVVCSESAIILLVRHVVAALKIAELLGLSGKDLFNCVKRCLVCPNFVVLSF
jgi:hypothetical protein